MLDHLVSSGEANSNRKEDIKAAVAEVMSSVDPDLKSDLNSRQILAIARAKIFGKVYNCEEIMNETITSLLRLRYSHKRKSRDEMVRALQSTLANDETSNVIRRKLLGI